jgi:hypothetical protein
MDRRVRRARIGKWYLRRDTSAIFQVTGYDDTSRTIEIQTVDGDLDEIEMEVWRVLPLDLVDLPGDWSGPVADVEDGDPDDSTSRIDGSALLGPVKEAWEDTTAEEEIDSYTERTDPGEFP